MHHARKQIGLVVLFAIVVGLHLPETSTLFAEVSACARLGDDAILVERDAGIEVHWADVARLESLTYCRLVGTIDERIGFEVRLPIDEWNGKLLVQGCRAYCGVLMTDDADDALARGYAVAGTDMGHEGKITEAHWAYDNAEAERDFADRATHFTAVAAKIIIDMFYDRRPARSYFRGCSTGGRQGLIAAVRHPDDFDGIVAGAPVFMSRGTLNLLNMGGVNLGAAPDDVLDGEALSLLHDRVLRQCDALDGTTDGVLDDPRACDVDPTDLICEGDGGAGCLTRRQADAAARIYSGARAADGGLLAPGPLAGSELNWVAGITPRSGSTPFYYQLAEDSLRYLAFDDDPGPAYSAAEFDLERDTPRMASTSTRMNPEATDLKAFRKRGAKMLLYHGWQDDSVSPLNSVDYYAEVAAAVGNLKKTQRFFRAFMVPGMNHCAGGPGPSDIDWLSALEDWVERDMAPNTLVGRSPDGTARTLRPFNP